MAAAASRPIALPAIAALLIATPLIAAGLSGAARAESAGWTKGFSGRIGAGAGIAPEYEGADTYEAVPIPLVEIAYKDTLFFEGDGLRLAALKIDHSQGRYQFSAGPLARFGMGRDEGDSDALRGMGDVKDSIELGGFLSFSSGPYFASLSLAQDVADGHDGLTAEASAGMQRNLYRNISLVAAVSTSWADSAYMQSYFGVTPAQAARSGYGVYRPSGGFKDVGVMAGISMPLSESWSVDLMAKYAHLLGDAADSPLVDLKGSANQFSAGLSLSYHF